jgi:rhamnulokinase
VKPFAFCLLPFAFMENESLYIAVDLGAGSGRVFLAGLDAEEFLLEEVRRFHYPPTPVDGHLRWDVAKIFAEIKTGLRLAGERALQLGRAIRSLAVDSWAVDYGLVDEANQLIENPVCYRDERTAGMMEKVFAQIPREEIFERTGIQFLVFNTLFQLYAQAQTGLAENSARLLLIPDLMNAFLTGRAVSEFTNATTTQMLNAASQTWDLELLERLNLPAHLLTEVVPAGTDIGLLKPELAEELNLQGVRVIAAATHDTASAVVGTPLENGWAYISSGTWSLVGVERHGGLINAEVAQHNFTNEGGAFATIRFLKNVMGLWILESCRKEWRERGFDVDYDRLLGEVAALKTCAGFIFPDDPRFLNPPNMLEAIAAQLGETSQPVVIEPAAVARVILDSLALRYASVLRTIESLTGGKLDGVHIVGGGSRNEYLNQVTANVSGLHVLAGPVEATVAGNILVQAVAAKRFATMAEARRHLARNIQLKKFTPQSSPIWEEAARSYAEVEALYMN